MDVQKNKTIFECLWGSACAVLVGLLLLTGCGSGSGNMDTSTEPSDTQTETLPAIESTTEPGTEIDTETETETEPAVKSAQLLSGMSDTGLRVMLPTDMDTDKQVGVFYFMWQGCGPELTQINDNTKIFANLNLTGKTGITLDEWKAAGGGGQGQMHWWGEPLFGYYDALDEWVVSRHLQMLAAADVDFIVVDQTNGVQGGYIQRINLLFETADALAKQGVNVPQIAFMAYDDGPDTVNTLYKRIYSRHPEWNELFYHWNGHDKPVIFDNITGYSKDASYQIDRTQKLASYDEGVVDALEIRDVSFPHETVVPGYSGTGLLYLDFRTTPQVIRDNSDGGYSFMNVSVAEISKTGVSINNVLSETGDRSRNWDGNCNLEWHGETDAWRYGYNFARQWQVALEKSPDMVFVTGWNEWIAQLHVQANGTISLIDSANINNSRDIEPMSGGYGDNYYLQMCYYIAQFKYGSSIGAEHAGSTTINGDADWEQSGVLRYDDPTGEAGAREHQAAQYPSLVYTKPAADNDISRIYVAADDTATYFRVDTAEVVKDAQKAGNLVLLIKVGEKTFAVNRTGGTDTTCPVEELTDGAWKTVGEATCRVEDKSFSLTISTDLIPNEGTLYIKWVDGLVDPADRMAYYTCPEAAPYGGFFLAFRK